MKENPKLKNICIKCGVDLYAAEGRFECQDYLGCKGIILPKETLQEWADKEQQKQHLINMMKADEELGLYEEPKQHIEFINANIEEFDKVIELFKQQTLEEAAERLAKNSNRDFIIGAKWQQQRSYSEEDLRNAFFSFTDEWICFEEWFEQFKKK